MTPDDVHIIRLAGQHRRGSWWHRLRHVIRRLARATLHPSRTVPIARVDR